MMKRISKGQIRAIWAKAHRLGLSEEELRGIVKRVRGKSDRISTMTARQAREVLDYLESMVEVLEGRSGRATRKQLWKIQKIGLEVFGDEKRLRRWIENKFGVSHPLWLSVEQAIKVIDGLKAMKRRGYKVMK